MEATFRAWSSGTLQARYGGAPMQLPAHADAGSLAVGSWRVSVSLRPASAHLRMGRSTVAQAFASRSFAGVAQPAGGVPVLLVFHPRRGQPVLFGRVSTGPGGWFTRQSGRTGRAC